MMTEWIGRFGKRPGWVLTTAALASLSFASIRAYSPEQTVLEQRLSRLVAEVEANEQHLQTLLNEQPRDRLHETQRRSQELAAAIDGLEQQLRLERLRLFPKDPMHVLLGLVIRQQPALELRDLRAEQAMMNTQENAGAGASTAINRRRIHLSLNGSFPALLQFVETLQALPWALQIEVLELSRAEHPITRLDLVLLALRLVGGPQHA